jgi:hypothetical protein
VGGDLLRLLQRSAILQIGRDERPGEVVAGTTGGRMVATQMAQIG